MALHQHNPENRQQIQQQREQRGPGGLPGRFAQIGVSGSPVRQRLEVRRQRQQRQGGPGILGRTLAARGHPRGGAQPLGKRLSPQLALSQRLGIRRRSNQQVLKQRIGSRGEGIVPPRPGLNPQTGRPLPLRFSPAEALRRRVELAGQSRSEAGVPVVGRSKSGLPIFAQ